MSSDTDKKPLEEKNVTHSITKVNNKNNNDTSTVPKLDIVDTNKYALLYKLESILGPILLTALSFYVRFYGIDRNDTVVWDEAHFGKFGSYYVKHEFYHDVHPPLGKMLIGLSEYLAGFNNPDFEFDSNKNYPDDVNFKLMRQFNASFGALCVPLVYYTTKWMGFNLLTVYLISLMVTLEHSYIVLSKFILLDSMLLFFTILTFACMVKFYTLRKSPFSVQWKLWMLFTGLSIGCVCSVKWVGLFITIIVGLYTVIDLWSLYCDKTISRVKYVKHWVIRIINLIIIPFLIYLFCFKIHFTLLYKTGTGDASTNTLFQINLLGNQIQNSPRDVMYGSDVTIRSHGLSPNLLHSHKNKYPDGSQQNQVTGYGFSDSNNNWTFKFSNFSSTQFDNKNGKTVNGEVIPITDGVTVRLFHKSTGKNLHSHEVPSHVSRGNFEVTGYGIDKHGDHNDDWIVEIVQQLKSSNPDFPDEDPDVLHPVSTFFRLRHKELGCYLTSTGFSYPSWGFKQSEIVCKNSWSQRDKSTWWNVEEHWNDKLEANEDYVPPKSKFWTDFVLINFAMAASNNALIPDQDKFDNLASEAWEWPTLHTGLRMCNWSIGIYRYFLMSSPFNTWLSTAAIILLIPILTKIAFNWRRQTINLTEDQFWSIAIQAVFPFLAWLSHYLPFVLMGRVTYVHHYVPALYFAMLIFGFVVDFFLKSARKCIKYPVYATLFAGCIYVYILFSPICQGMHGRVRAHEKMKWLSTWDMLI